jgi:hypothetical protein
MDDRQSEFSPIGRCVCLETDAMRFTVWFRRFDDTSYSWWRCRLMEHSRAESRESFRHGHDGEVYCSVEYRQIVAGRMIAYLVAPWK